MKSPRARKLLAGLAVGGIVGALAATAAVTRPLLVERGEWWTHDVRARNAAVEAEASRDVVIIDVAEADIEDAENHINVSWPWPRAMFGYLVDYCTKSGAKAVALDWVFQDRGLYGVNDLEEFAAALESSGRAVVGLITAPEAPPPPRSAGSWGARLAKYGTRAEALAVARKLLAWNTRAFVTDDHTVFYGGKSSADEVTATFARLTGDDTMRALFVPEGAPEGEEAPADPVPTELPADVLAREITALSLIRERDGIPGTADVPRRHLVAPVAILAGAAHFGNVVQPNDHDGIFRRHTPFVKDGDRLFPSLPMAAWMAAHPGETPRIDGRTLVVGGKRIALDDRGRFVIRYHGGDHVYTHIPAYAILRSVEQVAEGKPPEIPAEMLKDKYVIVSASAHSLRDIRFSPVDNAHLGAGINANALDNLLHGDHIARTSPVTDGLLAFALAVLLATAVVLVWSSITSTGGALLATTATAALLLGGWWFLCDWLYDARGTWMPAFAPGAGGAVAAFASVMVTSALERRDRRFVQEALGRYTSDELVSELMRNPHHLSLEWGERREMSVYFSDIAGFTTISEGLPPERLVALLNDYLTHMTEIVLAHGGVVDKYIGDAVMAFWGAPIPDADHARKAVLAAIAMRDKCRELRGTWKDEFGFDVLARAGVNSGGAVVGNMGSRHKYNYTVMGDMVNLASRLEGANKPYGTFLMISEFTHEKVKDVIAARELDKITVKGKDQPVTVYEVLAEKGKVDPTVAEGVRHFHEGLAHYRAQRFREAIECFTRARDLGDPPAPLYLERCEHFLKEPPGPTWDGVWHMKEK